MAKVYLLCGPIASGKTTYYESLKKKNPNTILLSHDELMLLLADDCEGRKAHVDRSLRISSYYASLAKQLINSNMDVVMDFGFWTKEERVHIQNELNALRILYEILYFKVDKETRLQRLHKRNEVLEASTKREYIISDEKFNRLDAFFEEPLNDEIYTLISD